MAESKTEKTERRKRQKYMLVSFGRMQELGWFVHNRDKITKTNKRVVIKTNRGLELGYLVGRFASYKEGKFKLGQKQLNEYYKKSDIEFACKKSGKFVRYASHTDVSEEKHLEKIAKEEKQCCRKFTEELNLPMKIVDVEHIFGGERIIFYFMADGRVDFRELVKKLADEYQTRIEMRQIGSRDEAKILGDFETCGQQCCCQRFLKDLKPVSMRMAKLQKATLDPAKISGYCGRLKCCLRYEDEDYSELEKRLPRRGTTVKTEIGTGKVVDYHILTQLLKIKLDGANTEPIVVPLEKIEVIKNSSQQPSKSEKNNHNNNKEHPQNQDKKNNNK